MKTGAIDIGSNSVRLMMWADGKTLYKRINTTRLGQGVRSSRMLSPEALERTAAAVADFYFKAQAEGAGRIYAFATAAVRAARNRDDFLNRVKELCGLDVDVVDGKTEATLGAIGAIKGGVGGVIDIGGASSEVCFMRGKDELYSYSANTGAVTLFDAAGRNEQKLYAEIAQKTATFPPFDGSAYRLYAVGGTATAVAALKHKLAVYDPEKVDGTVLSADETEAQAKYILSLSLEDVRTLAGMDVRRADVIGGGMLLLAAVMRAFGAEEVTVSESDNLEGYVMLKEGLV